MSAVSLLSLTTAPEAFSAPVLEALMVSASFGHGHQQASGALDQALQVAGVSLWAEHVDVLSLLSAPERLLTAGIYEFWLRHLPGLYRWFYQWTDRPSVPTAQTFGWLGLAGMREAIRRRRPEVVVSSFPTAAALVAHARRLEGQDFLNALVITDYRIHHHWARPEADLLLVSNPEAAQQLQAWAIPAGRIEVTGIPISPVYRCLSERNPLELKLKHGLDPELPLILLSGGGKGHYRASQAVLSVLSQLGRRVQVLELAGAQRRGTSQLGGATVHHLGYTTAFPELLAASDLVLGKAGGLTMAEATSLGVPMIIYAPIPGQEEHNAAYLQRHGAGMWVRQLSELRGAVLQALDPLEHQRLSLNALAIGVPDAAERVARALLRRLGRADAQR